MQLRPLVIFVFFFIDGVKVSERLWFCRANFLQPKPKSVGVGDCDLVHLWSEETLPHVCQQGGSLEDFPSPGFSLLDIFQPKQRRGRKYIESEDSLTNGKKQPDTLALALISGPMLFVLTLFFPVQLRETSSSTTEATRQPIFIFFATKRYTQTQGGSVVYSLQLSAILILRRCLFHPVFQFAELQKCFPLLFFSLFFFRIVKTPRPTADSRALMPTNELPEESTAARL